MKKNTLKKTILSSFIALSMCFSFVMTSHAEELVKITDNFEADSNLPINKLMLTNKAVSAKDSANDNGKIICEIPNNTQVMVVSKTSTEWYEVLYKGTVCYLHQDNLISMNPGSSVKEDIEEVVEESDDFTDEELIGLVAQGIITEGPQYEAVMKMLDQYSTKRTLIRICICVLVIILVICLVVEVIKKYVIKGERNGTKKHRRIR